MNKLSPFQIIGLCVGLALGIAIVYAIWNILSRLNNETIILGTGAAFTLIIVTVTGLIFVIYGLIQSRLRRQELKQDDWDELRKMQLLLGIGSRVNYHFKNAQLPAPPPLAPATEDDAWLHHLPEGEFKDTTIDLE